MRRSVWTILLTISAFVTGCSGMGTEPTTSAAQRRAVPAPEAGSAAANAEPDQDGVVCRRQIVTGSHRSVRVCTTREQREDMRESAQEMLRDVVREQAVIGSEGG